MIGRTLAVTLIVAGCSPAFDCVDCRSEPDAMVDTAPYVARTPAEYQDRMRAYDQWEDQMHRNDADQQAAREREEEAEHIHQQMLDQNERIQQLQDRQDQMQWDADHGIRPGWGPPEPPLP